MDLLVDLVIFAFIYLAATQIGQHVTRARLPMISGYLLAGVMVGPYVLNLVDQASVVNLRFIDNIALAFIAFAAGSELYLKELRSRLRSIGFITTGLVLTTFTLVTLTVLLLANYIPFMADMPLVGKVAVAIMAGAILVARSPSSAIAIIKELRARGPFTKTVLGVTVIMDVVVIILFALNSSVADALLTGVELDIVFILLVGGEIILSLVLGYVLSLVLRLIFSLRVSTAYKYIMMLVVGYGVFVLSGWIREQTGEHFVVEIFIEPLLTCMVAGFLVANFHAIRIEFLKAIEDIGPRVYIVFFTLTGASMALDVLAKTWYIALAMFAARLIAIMIGSFGGGVAAGDPMRRNRVSWMAFVTQAGVGLGLAKEAAVAFPEMGASFSTLIIAVIVINQVVGPPFFKIAIRRVGEDHLPATAHPDRIRDVLILGVEQSSLALARQLKAHGWKVKLADTDRTHVDRMNDNGLEIHWLPEITSGQLDGLITSGTDAVVAMLHDDEENFQACQIASESFGVPRLIARLQDNARDESLAEIGVMVVHPAAALVSLLDQSVRAPDAIASLLQSDPNFDTVQITITDHDLVDIPLRDIRFPTDVLVIRIKRGSHSIEPHGYSTFHLDDEVLLMGNSDSLAEISDRLGF
jgi:Trk K+ transport system NAD-binding subunit/Kef-type K+ transport system membrane component KefB